MSTARDYLSLPLDRFLQEVADRTPSPGGGSVAAAAGALSAALARMVLAYTAGRKQNAAVEPQLRRTLAEVERAAGLFAELLKEDIAAYERFVEARKSGDALEQERATATAIAVPLEIAAVAEAVASRMDQVKDLVNPALYSDVQVAVILAHATAEAAGLTAAGNLPHLPDQREAGRLREKIDLILTHSRRHREAVLAFQQVR